MNGAYVLSQVPSNICDISTTDGCTFQCDTPHPSLFYFLPLTRFFSPLFPPLPFSEFLLSATSCYQPFLPLAVYLFIPPPHTYCHLALFLQFITFFFPQPIFSYIYVSLYGYLSIPWSPPHAPPRLTLPHLLTLSTCLYLCLLSAVTPASHLGLF